jgi:hypothetical protein
MLSSPVTMNRLPASLEHMLIFIYLVYSMMALLYDTVGQTESHVGPPG